MDETLYSIWLQCVFDAGSPLPEKIYRKYSCIRNFYEAGNSDWESSGLFTYEQLCKLNSVSLREAAEIMENCRRLGYDIITRNDKRYPKRLTDIPCPPIVLYVAGVWPDIDNELCIGIVGTRDATPEGTRKAAKIAAGVVKAGGIVVSGGAIGIDTAAHKSALMANGRTISVLGCGIDTDYLQKNREMRKQIQQKGALVSEYPPGSPARAYHFPIRNRLISGLSLGITVVEAGWKSGAMITVRQALDQGRDVFAVGGNPNEYKSDGIRRLIEEGAKTIVLPEEILVEYIYNVKNEEMRAHILRVALEERARREKMEQAPIVQAQGVKKKSVYDNSRFVENVNSTVKSEKKAKQLAEKKVIVSSAPVVPDTLSEKGKMLCEVLQTTPLHIDELAAKAGLSARDALIAVTELEMEGLIQASPGKMYRSV